MPLNKDQLRTAILDVLVSLVLRSPQAASVSATTAQASARIRPAVACLLLIVPLSFTLFNRLLASAASH